MFSTPLGNILRQNIPEAQNKLFKASIYNSLTIILLILIGVCTVSVYFLFEIFIKPLMWALLVGTCLFPFKRTLTNFLRSWILDMEKSSQLLIVGASLFPFSLFYTFAEWITVVIISRIKLFLFYIIGVPLIYSIYNMGIISNIFSTTAAIYFSASNFMLIFGSRIVTLMILTMFIILFSAIIFYENTNTKILKVLSSCIWILSIVYLSSFAGSFALFLFTSTMVLLVVGSLVETLNINITQFSLPQLILVWEFITRPYKYSTKPEEQIGLSDEEFISELETCESRSFDSARRSSNDLSSFTESKLESKLESKDEISDKISDKGDKVESESVKPNNKKVDFLMGTINSTVHWCSALFSPIARTSPKKQNEKTNSVSSNYKNRQSMRSSKKIKNKTMVSRVFICLFWSHVIMYSWSHLWIILIMITAILLVTFKKILVKLEIENRLRWVFTLIKIKLNKLLGDRHVIIFPVFIRGSYKILLQFDEKLRKILDSCLDNLVSMFLIAFLLLGTIFLAIFLAFQVHNESLHLIALTSNVLNSTMSSELYSWLPERQDITNIMETISGNAYVYGREWISKKIDQLFETNAFNKANIEEQALELWEKLYQRVSIKNTTNTSFAFNQQFKSKVVFTRQFSILSLQKHIYSLWELLTSFDVLDINKISDFVRENLGLMSTVLESIWLVIRSNLNIVLTLLTGIFSAILGGGTVVLNFFVSLLIFLSALYYLLSYSKERYLPLTLISDITTNIDNNPSLQSIYNSVENGISSVFAVTLKMACFYGFYTSLTHTICGVNLVVIPSITAAILAVVPIVGTYWAAFPAITELVFINQEYASAVILFGFHLIPMYILDTAIYSEIKETGHPYLTGLAIAGGVYWLGLQGAVMGPLLLCTLVIVLNLFKTLILPDTANLVTERTTNKKKSTNQLMRAMSVNMTC